MSSTLTTGTRLKTKSSGLSDFFGGNGPHSNSTRLSPKHSPVTPSSPEVVQRVESSSSSVKSKKSHIPFWGRRKGGNVPSPSPSKRKPASNAPPSPPPPLPRPSGSSGSYANNGPSPPSSKVPSPPQLLSQLPPLNVSPPTLSSKFAAHFSPSKLPATKPRDIYASIHAPSSPPQSPKHPTTPSLPAHPNTTLQPPEATSTSRPSVESYRSSTSTTRPTITVSISPPEEFYKDEDYIDTDLFTLPRSAPTPPGSSTPASIEAKFTGTPGLTFDNYPSYFDIPSTDNASPSPPSSPRMQFPNPPSTMIGQYRIVRTRVKEKDAAKSKPGAPDELGASIARKVTNKRSTRKHSISVVKVLEDALGTPVATDLEDPGDDSDTNTIPTSDTGRNSGSLGDITSMMPRRRSSRNISAILQQQQSQQHKSDSPSAPPSPKKVPSIKSTASLLRSSVSPPQAGPPPTTPLPSPPVTLKDSPSTLSSLPTIPSMNSLPSRRSSALVLNRSLVSARPRAQTVSAVPPPNANLRAIPNSTSSRSLNSSINNSPRHSRVRPEDRIIDDDKANKENKRKPTYEELESLLEESQNQYNTLTAYLKTVSEKLEREKAAAKEEAEIWKKEAESWRREVKARSGELKKRDLEIDGLKWLILHPMPDPAGRNTEEYEDDDASTEAGSLATFGEQSERASIVSIDPPVKLQAARKRSMTLHDFRPRPQKFRRLKSNSSLRGSCLAGCTTSMTGLGLDFPIPDVPYTKYTLGPSASMSTSSSTTSSTSSLAVPGLSVTNTVSSGLSAIPESPLPLVPVDSAADAEKQRTIDERRSSRILRRTSGSSIVSLASMAASTAYANNLKSTRGQSIEQVLDNAPPNMDEVLERLRPFGAT